MYVIEAIDREQGCVRGYLVLTQDHARAHGTPDCDKASHFFRAPTAALVRERFQAHFTDLLRVAECCCTNTVVQAVKLTEAPPGP